MKKPAGHTNFDYRWHVAHGPVFEPQWPSSSLSNKKAHKFQKNQCLASKNFCSVVFHK